METAVILLGVVYSFAKRLTQQVAALKVRQGTHHHFRAEFRSEQRHFSIEYAAEDCTGPRADRFPAREQPEARAPEGPPEAAELADQPETS